MGAGRRVCFGADAQLVETKNTFVHFQAPDTFGVQARDALARRGTFSGGLTLHAEGARRGVPRGNTRAVTCQAHIAAVVTIPDLSKGRRGSGSSDSTDCPSPVSALSFCTETPTATLGCLTPISFTGCTPNFQTPPSTPHTAASSPWGAPVAQLAMQSCQTPPSTPHTTVPSPWASPYFQSALSTPAVNPLAMPSFPTPPSTPHTAAPSPWASPALYAMPSFQTPPSTPHTTAPSPWASPAFYAMPSFQTPPLTPHTVASPWATPSLAPQAPQACGAFPMGWQPLEAPAPKPRKRSRKKVAPPAEEHERTLLLRHVPLDYSPGSLLAELEQFLPAIDFYYLPTNFETKRCLGYAFVNFCDREVAAQFMAFWEKSGIPESDDVPVQDARMQGYAANVDHFRTSSVMAVLTADLKPRVFCRGVPKPFPEIAKKLSPVGPRFKPTAE